MNQHDLLQRAENSMPGACLGAMHLPADLRMVMKRGKGSKIYDTEGKEYIDYVLGSGPLLLGHSHPEVVKAVREQVNRGATFYALNTPAIELAEILVDAAPCAEAVRLQTTGSEATFAAARLARAWTGKDKILKFEGSFHGGHDLGQLSGTVTNPPPFPKASPDCDGIPVSVHKNVLVAPFNDVETVERIIKTERGKIAAVIVEPLQRVLKPEPGFLESIHAATREHAIPLIFDEVVTGFRLAWGGAQERYGVVPDLACYGKVIGGGFPLSAVVGKRDILELADPSRKGREPYCFLGGTLTGHPIACAAGLATLGVLSSPSVYKRLFALGEKLREEIQTIGVELDVPLQVLGDGPVLQTYFTDPAIPLKNHRDLLQADRKKAVSFGHELIRRGVFCTPGGKMYLSLAHTDADIDRTLEIVRGALKALQ